MAMSQLRGDLEVRHCRILVAVHDEGGVVAAAQSLGVSQSTVSEALLALERLLGITVLRRARGRGARLTPAVEALLPHVRALISASEATMTAFTGASGTVRLGVVESISSYLLPEPLRGVRKLWPGLEVQVTIGLCEDLRRRTLQMELDAAITIEGSDAQASSGPDTKTLAPARLQLLVSPQAHWADRAVSRDELREHSLLLADAGGAFNLLLRHWFGDPARCPRMESAGSIDGVKQGVLAGEVVGVLPSYTVASEVATGALVPLHISEPLPGIALYLTTLKLNRPSLALQLVTQQICRALESSAAA